MIPRASLSPTIPVSLYYSSTLFLFAFRSPQISILATSISPHIVVTSTHYASNPPRYFYASKCSSFRARFTPSTFSLASFTSASRRAFVRAADSFTARNVLGPNFCPNSKLTMRVCWCSSCARALLSAVNQDSGSPRCCVKGGGSYKRVLSIEGSRSPSATRASSLESSGRAYVGEIGRRA